MTQQNIVIGAADAKAGDTLFSAFTKTEANFTELYDGLSSQAQNVVVINSEADFPTQDVSTITLEANTQYFIGAHFSTAKTFTIEDAVTIKSIGPFFLGITYTGSGTMFNSSSTNWELNSIRLNCASGTLLNITGPHIFLMSDVQVLSCTNIGTIAASGVSPNTTVINNCAIFSVSNQGLDTTGAFVILSISQLFAISSTSSNIMIDLSTATFQDLELNNLQFSGALGSTAISGLASSANINTGSLATVTNSNLGGGSMVALSGITTDDIRWNFQNNSPITDTQPDALASFQSNATETVISASSSDGSNAVVIAGTWVEVQISHFTSTAGGRFTYIGERDLKGPVDISVGLISSGGGSIVVGVYIAVNGTPIIDSGIDVSISGSTAANLSIPWQLTFTQNDYVEIVVENQTNTTNIIADHAVLRIL